MEVQFYSQVPSPSHSVPSEFEGYYDFVSTIAQLSDEFNFTGSLIYYNHFTLDPLIIASAVIQNTQNNIPLIAIQPNAFPPHTIAKAIVSLHNLYGRKVNLNFITGNNLNELREIVDVLDHGDRYERLQEYIDVLKDLLTKERITYKGKYYSYDNFRMEPRLPVNAFPGIFVPGASEASILVANRLADVALARPTPVNTFYDQYCKHLRDNSLRVGIRIGIIARTTDEEAWEVAKVRFPSSRVGVLKALVLNRLQMNENNKQMSNLAKSDEVTDGVFWMGAYRSGINNNPYLVGSYEKVSEYIKRYHDIGVRVILLSDLYEREQFFHINKMRLMLNLLISEDMKLIGN
ncbi:LLM class flavin-dependent oxidoreductase [Paenibacillus tritici]|uniref:LLM class flavin-dependent oxidoreductase n=1 Tax=Paenibacillus tritici TaxID=1873425 RepID=UPI001BA80BB8|nr:LLM class flavin-dependent oxidoreductase [Paenibacillus tritici]QUL57078.1 LLM class flavin-dependent oxidoreductase [Paenibacillus tritici]